MDADLWGERDLLDEKQVNRLFGELADHALVLELVDLFEGESARLLAELQSARRMGDYGRMRFLAHTLCGSSLNMGARALAIRLRQLEELIQSGASMSFEWEELVPLLRETAKALRRH